MSSKVQICSIDGLDDGDVRRVKLEGYPCLAVYHVDGDYYVTNNTCTHEEASLSEGWLEGHTIACPVHNAEFDIRTGEALTFPASEDLPVYPAWIEGDLLFADLTNVRESLRPKAG